MIKTYKARKLGVRPAHRRMMLRQLAVSLIHYEKIATTAAKAKELKVYIDRMISRIAKISNPVIRAREASVWMAPNGWGAEKKLVTIITSRYQNKEGGYSRVVMLGQRPADRASLARIELLS